MKPRKWSGIEDGVIQNHYEASGAEVVQRILLRTGFRRTRRSIICRAHVLGLSFSTWTGKEDWIIQQCYEKYGARYCTRYIPKRSQVAIRDRARRLGLRSKFHAIRWPLIEHTDYLKALAYQGIVFRG